jgi:hypothetical protein
MARRGMQSQSAGHRGFAHSALAHNKRQLGHRGILQKGKFERVPVSLKLCSLTEGVISNPLRQTGFNLILLYARVRDLLAGVRREPTDQRLFFPAATQRGLAPTLHPKGCIVKSGFENGIAFPIREKPADIFALKKMFQRGSLKTKPEIWIPLQV